MNGLYKNIGISIILLLFGMMYSQTSNCDSLKAIYESKLFDWYKIDARLKTHDYTSRNEYDSLLALYHTNWNMSFANKKYYYECIGDSNLAIGIKYPIYRPSKIPAPSFSINEYCCKDSLQLESLPRLNKDSQTRMVDYIIHNYPDTLKYAGISCRVNLEFICNKEGLPDSTIVLKVKPKNMGGAELILETMKLAKFIPGRNKNGFKEVKMFLYFAYSNKGEFYKHRRIAKDKITLEFIPIY